MANLKVTAIINVKTANGWRRYPIVQSKNGKARAGFALIKGEAVGFEKFRYELRSYEGSKVTYQAVGNDPVQALNDAEKSFNQRTIVYDAKAAGLVVKLPEQTSGLASAAAQYLKRTEENDAPQAATAYRQALKDFIASAKGQIDSVEQIDESDMRRFHAHLQKKGNSKRTIANKHNHVKGFLMWAGVDKKKLGPRPRFEKKIPLVYELETVRKLIGAIKTSYFRVVVDVLRMAGLRDQEGRHLTWADVDFDRKLILVRSKADMGFTIKDKEERDVPLVPQLAQTLLKWKESKDPKSPDELVLATAKGKVNTKWLLSLKNVARRAGLNCGSCSGCRKKGRAERRKGKALLNSKGEVKMISGNECRKFTLHAFRRTYATMLSRNGIDVRTIMKLLGHSEITTTLAYLAPMTIEAAQALCNGIKW